MSHGSIYGGDAVHDSIRQRLLERRGLAEVPLPKYRYEDLERSEWSPEFERLMRNRLMMGALRYGLLGAPGKPRYDRTTSIIKRMEKYRETGNLELLVDVANLCLCEFVEGRHPNRHFHAVDDGEHVGVARSNDAN